MFDANRTINGRSHAPFRALRRRASRELHI
jgi:hypothetical protein